MLIGDKEIDKPVSAVIRLHDATQNPAVMFQVVLDPAKLSPSGNLIRFNSNEQSEIHGWKEISALEIVEILEEVTESP